MVTKVLKIVDENRNIKHFMFNLNTKNFKTFARMSQSFVVLEPNIEHCSVFQNDGYYYHKGLRLLFICLPAVCFFKMEIHSLK